MKRHYDRTTAKRHFQVGDKVLVLMLVSALLSAKFSGPYEVQEYLSDTDYVIVTPDRRRKTCVCHINMLKAYYPREATDSPKIDTTPHKAAVVDCFTLIVTPGSDSSADDVPFLFPVCGCQIQKC